MDEIWRAVCEGYEVSNHGNARSLDRKITYRDGRVGNFRGVPLSASRGNGGYLTINIGIGKRASVHRLVASLFVEKREGCDFVNHKNGDKRDNRAENLEWVSMGENNRHARETGLNMQHAMGCNLTKYDINFVAAVRRVHEKYSPTYIELSLLFDISQSQAADIVKGRTRKKG